VNYAGLEGDESYGPAQDLLPKGAGSIFTFGVKGGYEAQGAGEQCEAYSAISRNIGDTRSLIIHPARPPIASSKSSNARLRVPATVWLRLSVGIENVEDINRRSRSGDGGVAKFEREPCGGAEQGCRRDLMRGGERSGACVSSVTIPSTTWNTASPATTPAAFPDCVLSFLLRTRMESASAAKNTM